MGEPQQLTLYYAPISCALVPYVALEEAGVEFAVRVVNVRGGDHLTPAYLELNPKHKVPVLVVNGAPLTENVAILQWIARQYPRAQLLPDGLDEFRAIAMLAWCASGIHPHLTPNLQPERYCNLPGTADAVRHCAQEFLRDNFRLAESLLAGREWFFDSFMLPDIYFFWCFRRAKLFNVDLSSLPHCQLHYERVRARPSVAALLSFEAATLANMGRPAVV